MWSFSLILNIGYLGMEFNGQVLPSLWVSFILHAIRLLGSSIRNIIYSWLSLYIPTSIEASNWSEKKIKKKKKKKVNILLETWIINDWFKVDNLSWHTLKLKRLKNTGLTFSYSQRKLSRLLRAKFYRQPFANLMLSIDYHLDLCFV